MADGASRRSSRFSMRSKQLGQLLQETGDIKAEHVAKALKLQEQQGGLIGQILRNMGVCTDAAVRDALLKQVQVTDIHCEDLQPDGSVLHYVPFEQCETDKLCPFEVIGSLLCVVMGNPLNRRAINAIEEATRLKVKPFKAPWPKIKALIERSYTEENLAAGAEEAEPAEFHDADAVADAIQDLEGAGAPAEIAPPMEIPVHDPGDGDVLEAGEAEPEVAEPEPVIEGLDQLDDESAEVIETDKRGLRRRERKTEDEEVPQYKPKEAKVNVDLDGMDFTSAEEVVGEDAEEEGEGELEEIEATAPRPPARTVPAPAAPKPAARPEPKASAAPGMVKLTPIEPGYFFEGGVAPEEPGADLEALLAELPEAELVAESLESYQDRQAAAAPSKQIPAEATPAPAEPVNAIPLSEAEWNLIVAKLSEDPVGEWDWQYAAGGPIEAIEYEAEPA